MFRATIIAAVCVVFLLVGLVLWPALYSSSTADGLTYVIVDTGQTDCYSTTGRKISPPSAGESLYGQDAQYDGNQPSYKDNGDGTITDLNTGLIWQKTPPSQTFLWQAANTYADNLVLAGKSDWRLPTIKELLSIADFNGNHRQDIPYIDTGYFGYYDPLSVGQNRDMDGQYWSSTLSVARTMGNDDSAFGYNFTDGRIKAYPRYRMTGFVRCVRGNTDYGENDFKANGDGTISDNATGLMWMQIDSGRTMNWEDALEYAENLDYAGYSDWRLPNAKELQSIVDYTRAPDHPDSSRRSAAIDPLFSVTEDESWYWTGTTLLEAAETAVYVAFGRGTAANGANAHGSGCLRSDPKTGDPDDYPNGRGPQSDEIRIYNYVRCVRDIGSTGGGGTPPPSESGGDVDLDVTGFRFNKIRFQPGELIELYVRVRNRGEDRSARTTLSFYFSRRARLSADAELFSTAIFTPLKPDGLRWLRRTHRIPSDAVSGTWYIIVVCDEGGLTGDTRLRNNSRYKAISIL